jgi:hypothetical protein
VDQLQSPEHLREALKRAIMRLRDTASGRRGFPSVLTGRDETSAVADALELALVALESSMGECRMQAPYSTLRPVIDSNGQFSWCCNHAPDEHCRSG